MRAGTGNRTKDDKGSLEIVIRRDGQVVFRTFTEEMLNVAAELAPDDPKVRNRVKRRDKSRKRIAHDPVADS